MQHIYFEFILSRITTLFSCCFIYHQSSPAQPSHKVTSVSIVGTFPSTGQTMAPSAINEYTNGCNGTDTDSIVVKKNSRNDSSFDVKGFIQQAQSTMNTFSTNETTSTLSMSSSSSNNPSQTTDFLGETIVSTRSRFISEIGHVNAHYIDQMTLESLLDYIELERLTYMPQRGSRWDKVLKLAEFFALQISGYEKAVREFVPESKVAAKLIWSSCRLLIELGPSNAQALETAFEVFYRIGLSLSFFLHHHDLLAANSYVSSDVGQAFDSLLTLVREVCIYYIIRTSGLSSSDMIIDFNSVFGSLIESFYRHKSHIVEGMWKSKVGAQDASNIRLVRQWLAIHDRTTRAIVRDRRAATARRDEYTCEWFERYLLDFSRGNDDVLTVAGPAGCGKTFLAGWAVERLHRPLDRKIYEVLTYTLDSDLPRESTSIAVAKSLALQLLDTNIGSISLLQALTRAHDLSFKGADIPAIEKALWESVDAGMQISKKINLMIVIDGFNEIDGHDKIDSISKHIQSLASKHSHAQAILFCRKASHLNKSKTHLLEMSLDLIHNDLRHITEHTLQGYRHFEDQNDHEREAIVEHINHASNGNFLWIILASKLLKQETTHDGFIKALKALKEKKESLDSIINKLAASVDLNNSNIKLLLSWILVAKRPLRVEEVRSLLQVDFQKKALLSGKEVVEKEIADAFGPLVTVRNGVVSFRHEAVRAHFADLAAAGTKFPTRENIQADFTTRLLAYCKFRAMDDRQPSFEGIRNADADSLLKNEPLVEYALRNWIIHFRESSLYKDNNTFDLSNEFRSCFPDHVQYAMLEAHYWDDENVSSDAINMHRLALLIRQNILTDKHPSLLQTLINYGNFLRNVGNNVDASNVFYQASVVSRSILEKYSTLTIRCVIIFLELVETLTFTSRTEVSTKKEEMLKYIIEVSRHRHGNSSDVVIRYSKILAEFYVSIHEETHAEPIWRELQEIMITRYGKGSVEESNISGHLGVVLKKGHKHKDITEYEREIFATSTEVELWDLHRIKITLELAVLYEEEGKLFEAEELYINLWSHIITHCHGTHSHGFGIEVHVSMIDILVVYVEFLRRHHRHEEAAGILICIWEEYGEYDFESEVIFLRLKAVGELMLALNLSTTAISVFQKCGAWFRAHNKYEHVESCETLISKTTRVIINTTESTSSSTEKTITTSSFTSMTTEKVITESFESVISKSKITTETVSICSNLISYHVSLEQWSKAIEISKRSLELIWKTIVSGSGTIALPREFSLEAIDIAVHLAICYRRSHHFHEAEEVYLRIYRACWNSCHFDDKRFTRSYTVLIEFYREHGHWSKVIEVYQKLLIVSRKQMGVSHALTIEILYALGGICTEHGHSNAHDYYEEIITVLNRHGNHCHKDSITALTVLSRFYYEAGLWEKAQSTCGLLWETWIYHHQEHDFEAQFIELLYARYVYVLEYHAHVEYEFLRNLTILYHSTCSAVFGASAVISVQALVKLADVSMRNEKYIHEAIAHYEEVIKVTKTTSKSTEASTTVITTTISSIEEKLSSAYIQVCSHSSVTSTTVERAIYVLTQRFEHLKITLSCSHAKTLVVLRELLLLQCKIMSEEIRLKITKTLIDITVTTITKEKHSKTLYEAARSLANIYISCGLIEEGRKVLREIRGQIISKTYGKDQKSGFQIPHSVGKESYVFLVSFEEVLFGSLTVNYSKLMADLLTEAFLYESYSRSVKSHKTERMLTAGARLYVFLLSSSRKEEVVTLQSELHKIFMHKWGAVIKASNEITTLFLVTILKELGKETQQQSVEIGHAACIATNDKVRDLLEHGHHKEAFELAQCAFYFFDHEGTYHHIQNVGYGFKLSGYMASRGLRKDSTASIEPKLRTSMLELSRKIITDVLKSCKHEKINFVQLKIGEVNDLVGLLGEQENYLDLEWLLQSLWTSRDVQKSWSSTTITSIGKSLVLALFLLERKKPQGTANYTKAFRLGEAIYYNLRRVGGGLSPRALAVSDLMSQLYTATGHHREAMGVHEEILRLVVEADDGDDTVQPQVAKLHVELLKRSHQRLGGWDKKAATYKELVDRILQMPEYKNSPEFKGLQGIEKWDAKVKADDGLGQFQVPKSWEFIDPNLIDEKGDFIEKSSSNGSIGFGSNLGFRRITNNWGMGSVYKDLFGDEKEPVNEFGGL